MTEVKEVRRGELDTIWPRKGKGKRRITEVAEEGEGSTAGHRTSVRSPADGANSQSVHRPVGSAHTIRPSVHKAKLGPLALAKCVWTASEAAIRHPWALDPNL